MEQSLPLINDLVEQAKLKEPPVMRELQKIKYNGEKVWPQLSTDPVNCLQFSADDVCSVSFGKSSDYKGDLYYLVNSGEEFTKYPWGSTPIEFGGSLGTLYVYGTATQGKLPPVRSTSTVPFRVSGHLSALVYWNEPNTEKMWNDGISCYDMFYKVGNLTDISNLIFFESCDRENAYKWMFSCCGSLVKVPEKLVCSHVMPGAFYGMFYGCESLVHGMEFDCRESECPNDAFSHVYEHCTSLVEAPPIRTKNKLANGMDFAFHGCTSLTKITYLEHPSGQYCYQSAFEGCTALEEVPAFLKENVAVGTGACYQMFKNCNNLKTVGTTRFVGMFGSSAFEQTFIFCVSLNMPKIYLGVKDMISDSTFNAMFYSAKVQEAELILQKDHGTLDVTSIFYDCFADAGGLRKVHAQCDLDIAVADVTSNFNCFLTGANEGGNFTTNYANFPRDIVPKSWTFTVI